MFLHVLIEEVLKERTGCCQDNLVSLYLLAILTSQGHICEIDVLSKISEGCVDTGLEVVPFQTKLFRHHGTNVWTPDSAPTDWPYLAANV